MKSYTQHRVTYFGTINTAQVVALFSQSSEFHDFKTFCNFIAIKCESNNVIPSIKYLTFGETVTILYNNI